MKIQNQINLKSFSSQDGFIFNYQKLIKDVVLPYQYQVLNDNAEGAEKSHVIKNFINAGKALLNQDVDDGFYGMVFQDSDAAKWLEAVAYSLVVFPDKELEKIADDLICIIKNAQDKDGYLNTYYTIKDSDKRWTNLHEGHELYCAGHMMEAACAYYEATGKNTLLKVMEKNAEHIYSVFMNKDSFLFQAYPGHPEVELALLKMYKTTKNKHFLELAEHFINVRGENPHFFADEKAKRTWSVWNSIPDNGEYAQNAKPVREQSDATGHSVRAVYLYDSMADLAGLTDDEDLKKACKRLWHSITQKRMYITGGIGSTVHGEAFSVDYDLPNDTAYCETCASIGLMFFASKMLEMDVNNEYADVMEKAFYNTVLAGMQLDGKKFFYVNPLEIIPGIAGVAQTHKHDLPQRPQWYACACCPPNVARLISSFAQYAYGENDKTSFCHLYADGKINFNNGNQIICKTKYPYEFDVKFEVCDVKNQNSEFAIRIPSWSKKFTITKNGKKATYELKNGYAYINICKGDEILLKLDSNPYFVYPSTKIPDLNGNVAICRGPLVYCMESVDNNEDILSLCVNPKGKIKVLPFEQDLLSGTTPLLIDGYKIIQDEDLYSFEKPKFIKTKIKAVPYYTWGNRGINQMKVWFSYK